MSDSTTKPRPGGGTFEALRFCEVRPLGFALTGLAEPATLTAAIPVVMRVAGLLELLAAEAGSTVH